VQLGVSDGIDLLIEKQRDDNHRIELVDDLPKIGLKVVIRASNIYKYYVRVIETIFNHLSVKSRQAKSHSERII